MIQTRVLICDVPVAEDTIFTLRSESSYMRVFYFENLTDSTLNLQLEYSADGGNSWSDLGSSFSLGPVGGGEEVEAVTVTDSNILRCRASGGGSDRDVMVSIVEYEFRPADSQPTLF